MLYYIRDDVGSLIGMKYNEDVYYYIKNLQEDIIGIKDANFNLVATYEYDSWGKILSIKDSNGIEITDTKHIAHINPFRYRSYYYDEETGLYYLKSRYYNPVWGRFLNADSYAGVNNSILGYNLYIYSNNNPINYSDDTGQFFKKAFNWIKSTAKKVVKTIKNVVTKLKEAFVIETEAGFGYGFKLTVNDNFKFGGSASKTVGYSSKYGHFTSTSASVDLEVRTSKQTDKELVQINYGFDIRKYDNGDTNPMAFPSVNEILDCWGQGTSIYFPDKNAYYEETTSGTFIGVAIDALFIFGFKLKIGFTF